MGGEWKEARLSELCDFRAGSVFKPTLQGQTSGEFPFVKVSDMNLPANAVYIQDANNWVSATDLQELRAKPFPAGTVVFAKIGEALRQNRLRLVVRETVVDNNMMGAVPHINRIDPRFFYYALSRFDFSEVAQGTALPYLTVASLSALTLDVPPPNEQRAIAHILGTLDDKIELNRKQNETLEAMARALFKAWFVDFEPVRAKMEGRWQRGQSLPGLPAHLYDLFPDRLVDSELGEIPEGWECRTVGDCFDLTMGQSPPGNTYNVTGDGLPFFQGRTDFGFRYPENRQYCSAPTRFANAEDTLVSVRAPVGDINLAWEKCCIGRGVAAIRHASHARSFTYHAIWSLQDKLKQFEHTGTVFGSINKKQFEGLAFIEPSRKVIEEYEANFSGLDDAVRSNIEESRTLAQLRDTLLPKLISGELRVKDAEAFLKERGL